MTNLRHSSWFFHRARAALTVLASFGALFSAGLCHGQILFYSSNGGGTIDEVSTLGVVTTFATGLQHPGGVVFGTSGNLYVTQALSGSLQSVISQVTPDGVVHPFATGLQTPLGLTFDSGGNIIVADYGLLRLSTVTSAGVVSSFASTNSPFSVALATSGNLFVANRDNNTVVQVTPTGTVLPFASGFNNPNDLAFDSSGNLFVSNFANSTISMVTPGGIVSTFVSSSPDVNAPVGLAFDLSGNLYIANQGLNSIARVTPGGTVSTFVAGLTHTPQYLAFQPVPEPSTTALVAGLGALVSVAWMRRRRRSQQVDVLVVPLPPDLSH